MTPRAAAHQAIAHAVLRTGQLAGDAGAAVLVLGSTGVLRPMRPSTVARAGLALRRWGTGLAGGFTAMALREPDRVALVDELGELTWRQLHRRSNALARALAERGVREDDGVAVLCRNHRGLVEAALATAKLGADLLLLNTAFAAPQLAGVLEREGPRVVVHDEEFTDLLAGAPLDLRVLAWVETESDIESIDALTAATDDSDLAPPGDPSRIVILTSGTTGEPKGAARSEAGLDAAVSLLSRLPLRYGWRTHIAAPLFHTWGLAHLGLAMLLGSTVVLRRRFDPAECVQLLERDSCDSLVAIPVMLQRIVALDPAVLEAHPTPSLKLTATSGSALPPDLAWAWMDAFGDTLYNVYGSTEVACASIATPEDLRAAPTSAGKPPRGSVVRIVDDEGREVARGSSGRIFVGNGLMFDGYTGGGSKEVIDGLMSSGDLGRFDDDGRLYVVGREDDMIVSGGENVFPQETEDCLSRHPGVLEATAVGVPDDEFGQRLRGFVVPGEPRPSEEELIRWVRQQLARYQVPREIVFLDELPRNATGKIVKRELAEHD